MTHPLCPGCGEPILHNPVYGMHDDCYAVADMPRLHEAATRDDNPRHIVRFERIDACRVQAIWNDVLPTAPTEKGEVVCQSG